MQRSRSGCFLWIVLLVLVGTLLYSFRSEFVFLRDFLLTVGQGKPLLGFPDVDYSFRILRLIVFNIVALLFFGLLILYWLASSAFPVQDTTQVFQLMRRIVRGTFGKTPPLLMVHNGMLAGELSQRDQNTLLLGLESAVVVETHRINKRFTHQLPKSVEPGIRNKSGLEPRVEGAGLVFVDKWEQIRDLVNLRKQQRSQTNVLGQTSDGIELSTNPFAVFTLDQSPDVVHVAYLNDQIADNLRVVRIDPQEYRIVSIIDELDYQDKSEIHSYAQNFLNLLEIEAPLEVSKRSTEYPPYQIDPDRIRAGVYSRARNVGDQNAASHWTDLPAMAAAETFRNMIAHYSFDKLYQPDDPVAFPLIDEIKPEFTRRLRFMGVISYQFITRQDGGMLEIGQKVNHHRFRISSVQRLVGSKLLRDHGIKVIFSGFSDLMPTDPLVNEQRLALWRTRWQQKANQILAEQDNELVRIKDASHTKAERELLEKLSCLLEDQSYSDDMLASVLFQELERIATDPLSRQQLPRDIINKIRTLRFLLLPDETGPIPTSPEKPGATEE